MNKFPSQLFDIFRNLISKKAIFITNIVINFVLIEVIGNVIDWVVISRILVIDEDELVVRILDDYVIGQKVVVRKDQ